MLASIIIPARGRSDLLDRAISSIKTFDCDGIVEIVIVDDCSDEPVSSNLLREHDKVLRLQTRSGAAVARNYGILHASADIIFLLDSDDYILQRDFVNIIDRIEPGVLYYSSISSQGFVSDYPLELELDVFFDSIFFKEAHIGQTSSLCFVKSDIFKFDESLPKHQDWDFVLNCLLKDIPVKLLSESQVFFDRADRGSLSRVPDSKKSYPWINKLRSIGILDCSLTAKQIRFHLLGRYVNEVRWPEFIKLSLLLFLKNKTSFIEVIKRLYYRFF